MAIICRYEKLIQKIERTMRSMDTKFIIATIIFIILISLQYTLNRILKELIEIKNILLKDIKSYYK